MVPLLNVSLVYRDCVDPEVIVDAEGLIGLHYGQEPPKIVPDGQIFAINDHKLAVLVRLTPFIGQG